MEALSSNNYSVEEMIAATSTAPPAFDWNEWYESVGGRSIDIPEVQDYMHRIHTVQVPLFDGPTADHRHTFASANEASALIKETARSYGADLVGVCEIESTDIYRGRTVDEHFAIAVGMRMNYAEFQDVPSYRGAIECMRIYYDLGDVVIKLAQFIRSLGYACRVEHPVGDSSVLHIPIALKCGFGELGRHGSIINPQLGPLFRMGSVLTSMPLAIDHPIDAGIAAFCDSCKACRIYCPANAIPDARSPEGGKDHLGNDRYMIDTGKCFPYFAKHYYCSACLPVCVYNHKEWARDFSGAEAKNFPTVIFSDPPPPADTVAAHHRHDYPHVHRDVVRTTTPNRARRNET